MLRSNKSALEKRFELLTTGLVMIVAAVCYILFWTTELRPLVLFIPGLILLGSAIFQDLQPGWFAGWLNYLISSLLIGTGLAALVNVLLGNLFDVPGWLWVAITVVELGAVLIAKALYDPTLGRPPREE